MLTGELKTRIDRIWDAFWFEVLGRSEGVRATDRIEVFPTRNDPRTDA